MGNEYSVSVVSSNWTNGTAAGGFNRNVNNPPSTRHRNHGRHVLFVQEIRELKNTCILIALPLGKT